MAVLITAAAVNGVTGGATGGVPPEMELRPAGSVHGDAAGSRLTVVGHGDVDGDGIEDLAVEQTTYRGGAEARDYRVVLGRADWPVDATVDTVGHAHSLGFPQNYRPGPNDPAYEFQALADVDGDGVADLVVRKDDRVGDRIRSRSAQVYLGRTGWAGIDVANDPPDLSVRQRSVPTNDAEADRRHLPDRVYPGDYNGDGRRDLAVASCGVPPGSPLAGAIHLYLAPEHGLGAIDLSRDAPDAIIRGQGEDRLGCAQGQAGTLAEDLTGDGATDLLLTTRPPGGSAVAVIVAGRADWPPVSEVADIADVTIANPEPRSGLSAELVPDMNGDGRLDVVARYENRTEPSFDCVLGSGRRFGRTETGADCDCRFPELHPTYAFGGDYDGDGHCDLVFAWPRHGCTMADYEWRLLLGPVAPGADVRVGESSGQGDAVFLTPNVDGLPTFAHMADFDGDGVADLALGWAKRRNPDREPEAGAVAIYRGPVLERATTETPTAADPTPTTTPTPAVTVRPTSEPSATASGKPTEIPPRSAYLPAAHRAR